MESTSKCTSSKKHNSARLLLLIIAGLMGITSITIGGLTSHTGYIMNIHLHMAQQYFMFYNAVILAVALLLPKKSHSNPKILLLSGICFTVGILLFTIPLWLKVVYTSAYNFIMPYGGSLVILGWILFVLHFGLVFYKNNK